MMKSLRLIQQFAIVILMLVSSFAFAQTTVTIGTGTSSSSTRGPFQRADTNSTTVFSRFVQVYTASELASAGLINGAFISSLNWELASSNTIVGAGNASLKIYVKNSSATKAVADTFTNIISGASLVHNVNYNTTNNFPGANGWMPFAFSTPFAYTGGALEIAVDWDCSTVTTPVFSNAGDIKWRWASTAPDTLVVKQTASSGAPSYIGGRSRERANIQIVFSTSTCTPPTNLYTNNVTSTTADLNWTAESSATSYNWKVVPTGAGSGAMAVDSGTTTNTMVMASGLDTLTSYDFYVKSICGTSGTSAHSAPYKFLTMPPATSAITIGAGTSSSSTRGPFQRSDTNSTTVFSRWNHVYSASELATAGFANGSVITALNWDLASSNVIIGSGNAVFKVYIKNSSATAATSDTWANIITGADLVVDELYNTGNNFPGSLGWMSFNFNAPFTYTGGGIEVAVDWDCSQVSSPAFDGDGSLKWVWESTAPVNSVAKKTASSGSPSTLSDLKDERANIQFVYATAALPCALPTGLSVSNIDTSSADVSWVASASATMNMWKVVAAGAGSMAMAVDSGATSTNMASATGLAMATSYDLYVESDCGALGLSGYAGPFNFMTTDNFGLLDNDFVTSLVISPNPSKGFATIELALTQNAEVGISVYSVTGQLVANVLSENLNQLSQRIDLSSYQDGLYFVFISINDQTIAKKIILLK